MTKCPSCGTSSPGISNFCAKCGHALQGATGRLDAETLLEGRYVIIGLLGRGGMGAVYKAIDLRLDKTLVAIKEMSTAALGPGKLEKALEAFKKEASMLIKLRHHSLPRVTDFFSAGDDRWYLVMDYIEGKTLETIIQRLGRVLEKELIDWALQMCDVLGYLHGQEPPVIFRDIKPSNIMLTLNDEVKLIDFGIARHFNPATSSDTTSFASIGFAPPEQFGEGQTDHRSDIYSLGVTLHYLLTGVDPAKNPFKFAPPDQLVSASKELSDLVMQMVETDPMARPQGVGVIKNRLLGIREKVQGSASTEVIEPISEADSQVGITELHPVASTIADSEEVGISLGTGDRSFSVTKIDEKTPDARQGRYETVKRSGKHLWFSAFHPWKVVLGGLFCLSLLVAIIFGIKAFVSGVGGLHDEDSVIRDNGAENEVVFELIINEYSRPVLAAGVFHTVGLRSDGSVVAVGNNEKGPCNVSSWSNIVAVAGGLDHTIGLRSDGSVVAVGLNGYGQCDVSSWSNIVAVAGGRNHTIGLRSDGSVVAVGYNYYGRCDVSHWSDIKTK